jgi:hypothetical protein
MILAGFIITELGGSNMIKLIWNTTTGLAFLAFAAMLLSAGCATTPCEAQTCTPEQIAAQQEREGRDPFGREPITFGSIFGPQPVPGEVTVAK